MNRVDIKVGEWGVAEMPYSEVCMHMQVAGKMMLFQVLDHSAQLYQDDAKTVFSAPITLGEAGVYTDSDGSMYYFTNQHRVTELMDVLIENLCEDRDEVTRWCCAHRMEIESGSISVGELIESFQLSKWKGTEDEQECSVDVRFTLEAAYDKVGAFDFPLEGELADRIQKAVADAVRSFNNACAPQAKVESVGPVSVERYVMGACHGPCSDVRMFQYIAGVREYRCKECGHELDSGATQ